MCAISVHDPSEGLTKQMLFHTKEVCSILNPCNQDSELIRLEQNLTDLYLYRHLGARGI